MNEDLKWTAAALAVIAVAVAGFIYFSDEEEVPVEAPPAAVAEQPADSAQPAVKYPVPAPPVAQPLPPLNESDQPAQGAVADLIGQEAVERFIVPEQLIRHMVVTIDNLSNEKVAERLRPVKPTPGTFAVGGSEEAPVLDSSNYARYQPFVQLISTVDTAQLVATYTRYYPLFQEAYENLGHPPQYFNDRLIEVIDHLLETPEPLEPIALVRPSVQYEFADPELEARSAGQKVLIRMGRENAAAIKDKLRELRSEIIAGQARS